MVIQQSDINRFWSKVDQSGDCWIWTGKLHRDDGWGYGRFYVHTQEGTITVKVHRLAYMITYGDIPSGLCVCHRCDNPRCIRPDHLFLGTNLDNIQDMVQKGRQARGERNGLSRFTSEQVRSMRHLYTVDRMRQAEIARVFGVDRRTVNRIVRYQLWRDVAD
jgi:predicted XRE-type DNA-binding protein